MTVRLRSCFCWTCSLQLGAVFLVFIDFRRSRALVCCILMDLSFASVCWFWVVLLWPGVFSLFLIMKALFSLLCLIRAPRWSSMLGFTSAKYLRLTFSLLSPSYLPLCQRTSFRASGPPPFFYTQDFSADAAHSQGLCLILLSQGTYLSVLGACLNFFLLPPLRHASSPLFFAMDASLPFSISAKCLYHRFPQVVDYSRLCFSQPPVPVSCGGTFFCQENKFSSVCALCY